MAWRRWGLGAAPRGGGPLSSQAASHGGSARSTPGRRRQSASPGWPRPGGRRTRAGGQQTCGGGRWRAWRMRLGGPPLRRGVPRGGRRVRDGAGGAAPGLRIRRRERAATAVTVPEPRR
ncbi:hypothetical protein PVAP13_9NG703814 [Panicum virgatum]|uniref:Uncharacterized protein n=1 Tax=Panicum virgatum TaxID=38727 RepID=A0A8T0MWI6_PANVG|nr:hypothetical protein PVAP13_9NG703814 [Panicum virgatum]